MEVESWAAVFAVGPNGAARVGGARPSITADTIPDRGHRCPDGCATVLAYHWGRRWRRRRWRWRWWSEGSRTAVCTVFTQAAVWVIAEAVLANRIVAKRIRIGIDRQRACILALPRGRRGRIGGYSRTAVCTVCTQGTPNIEVPPPPGLGKSHCENTSTYYRTTTGMMAVVGAPWELADGVGTGVMATTWAVEERGVVRPGGVGMVVEERVVEVRGGGRIVARSHRSRSQIGSLLLSLS